MHLFGTILYGWQSYGRRLLRIEILLKYSFEIGKQVAIDHFAGHELAFVKAHAMIEQSFYVGSDNLLGMLVDGVLQFFAYLVKTIQDDPAFAVRHVEGFVRFIREKSIVFHPAGEGSSV